MKNAFKILLIGLLALPATSQTIQQIDSVTVQMCKTLSGLPAMGNQEKLNAIMQKHLPELYRLAKISSQQEADTINDRVFYRLQRNCNAFSKLLGDMETNKSDWKILDKKPQTTISNYDYNLFLKGGNFYYMEYSGKIVKVKLHNNQWVETFEDGTISKLILRPKNDAVFDLEFVKSDNEIRKNVSVKGDLYTYGIFAKDENSYDIWVATNDSTVKTFKLYMEKIN